MNTNERNDALHGPDQSGPYDLLKSSGNTLAIYTVARILMRMRREVGLEAMLEYIAAYIRTIDAHNAPLTKAADQAVAHLNIEKVYQDGIRS